jgi:hypothetical protein
VKQFVKRREPDKTGSLLSNIKMIFMITSEDQPNHVAGFLEQGYHSPMTQAPLKPGPILT